jgi:hypothetical protein
VSRQWGADSVIQALQNAPASGELTGVLPCGASLTSTFRDLDGLA